MFLGELRETNKKLIEQMVREAVKQYAVDPDQFFTQSPLGELTNLKTLQKPNLKWRKNWDLLLRSQEMKLLSLLVGYEVVFENL